MNQPTPGIIPDQLQRLHNAVIGHLGSVIGDVSAICDVRKDPDFNESDRAEVLASYESRLKDNFKNVHSMLALFESAAFEAAGVTPQPGAKE